MELGLGTPSIAPRLSVHLLCDTEQWSSLSEPVSSPLTLGPEAWARAATQRYPAPGPSVDGAGDDGPSFLPLGAHVGQELGLQVCPRGSEEGRAEALPWLRGLMFSWRKHDGPQQRKRPRVAGTQGTRWKCSSRDISKGEGHFHWWHLDTLPVEGGICTGL